MKSINYLSLFVTFFIAFSCNKEPYNGEPKTIYVENIELNSYSLSILEGECFLLEATISPVDADNKKIAWSSSDPNIAIVEEGLVTGIQPGEVIITVAAEDHGCFITCNVTVGPSFIVEDGQKCVDLGLSVKWAYYNVGASSPEDFGDLFAWGELEPKSTYSESNYKHYENYGYTKYGIKEKGNDIIDYKTTLDLSDDAAHHYYGGSWRMPTIREWEELHNLCTWEWTKYNTVAGYLVKGKNGNQIFLPYAGCKYYDYFNINTSSYWTSSLEIDAPGNYAAYSSELTPSRHYMSKEIGYTHRCMGLSIRGVIE